MKTELTRSGIYIRSGKSGSAVYSPYTGSFFVVDPRYDSDVKSWLNCNHVDIPSSIRTSLGIGWASSLDDNSCPTCRILPNEDWGFMNSFDRPLLINWLLTGNCGYDCPYCYAQDLMNGKCREPRAIDVERIAEKILAFDPLAVVLTGGDPLLSPHLRYAIDLLHRKAGVIVDTSGFRITDEHIESFFRNRVFLRISLDAETVTTNVKLRPMKQNSTIDTGGIAIQALSKCLSRDVNLGIQTVLTRENFGDLESLGLKLLKLGVRNWRLMRVAHTAETDSVLRQLQLTVKNDSRFQRNVFPKLLSLTDTDTGRALSVQLSENDVPNAVILVSPDGVFYTEAPAGRGKQEIDPSNKTKPRISALVTNVDMHAHARRYLYR